MKFAGTFVALMTPFNESKINETKTRELVRFSDRKWHKRYRTMRDDRICT